MVSGFFTLEKDSKDIPSQSMDGATAITKEKVKVETPEDALAFFKANDRNIPEGFEYVPTVPTGEDDYGISAKNFKKIGTPINVEKETPSATKTLLDYKDTSELASNIYQEGVDILADEEIMVKHIPQYLRPYVRMTAKVADKYIVKPLAVAVTGVGETAGNFGEALTRAVHEGITEDSVAYKILGVTGKEMLPFNPETAGKKFSRDAGMALEVAEAYALGAGRVAGLGARRADQVIKEELKKSKPYLEKKAGMTVNNNLDVSAAKVKELEVNAIKTEEARKVASKNDDITVQLIKEFEDANEVDISKKDKKGKIIGVDYEKVRGEGVKILDIAPTIPIGASGKVVKETKELADTIHKELGNVDDRLTEVVLNPNKMDGVVATLADVKKKFPEEFTGVDKDGKKKTLIDELFDVTVKKKLIVSDEIKNITDKYGISIDDFILMTIGSGSKFGRGLKKFRDMRDAVGGRKQTKSDAQIREEELNNTIESLGKFGKNFRRSINVMRGLLVGTFTTAIRNFESTLVRLPYEGLTNLFETGIIALGRGLRRATVDKDIPLVSKAVDRITEGVETKAFVSTTPFRDSFQFYGHILGDAAVIKKTGAKGYLASKQLTSEKGELVDYILSPPEMKNNFTRFYDQVLEIQKGTGRGEGGLSDKIFNPIEDFVQFINGPNRLQEFVTRRAYFLTDLDNLLKKEWGIGLDESIKAGQMRNLVNDSPSLKPAKARSWAELVTDATDRALEKTYAAQPKFPPFKAVLDIFNRFPIFQYPIPFPRFIFSSMEHIAQLTFGSGIAGARIMLGAKGGKWRGNPARDAEIVARNMAGLSVMGGIYYMMKDEDSPTEYNKVRTFVSPHAHIDTQALYPVPQLNYTTAMFKAVQDDRFGAWWKSSGGSKEFIKVYTGTGFRSGMLMGTLLDDFVALAEGEGKLMTNEKLGRMVGTLAGDLNARIFQPLTMQIDAERAMGLRPSEFRDFSKDPNLTFGGAFTDAYFKKMQGRGFLISGEDEASVPLREFPTDVDGKRRLYPGLKQSAGLTIVEPESNVDRFLKEMGINPYKLGSRSGIGPVDRTINSFLKTMLPAKIEATFIPLAAKLRAEGKSEKYIRNDIENKIMTVSKNLKSDLSRIKNFAGDDPIKTMAIIKLRTMPHYQLKDIISKFEDAKGIDFDITNNEHLLSAVRLSQRN